MKQFKQTALALAMVGMLSAQVQASEAQVQNLQAAQPIATFSQTDIDAIFEQAGQPMQLAALSPQEMMETEGALAALGLAGHNLRSQILASRVPWVVSPTTGGRKFVGLPPPRRLAL